MNVAMCIGCGCEDDNACLDGCSWLAVDRRKGIGVCSSCPNDLLRWRQRDRSFSPRALLRQASVIVREYRDLIYRSASDPKGRVNSKSAREELAVLDKWLEEAEAHFE